MAESARPFRAIVLCYCAFGLVQAATAAWLFLQKLGWAPDSVATYYLGAGAARPRSLAGMLEVLVPHLLAIPLTLFILVHLAGWAEPAAGARLRRLANLTFASAAIGLGAGLLTRFASPSFASLKLASTLVFELLLCWWVLSTAVAYWRPPASRGALRSVG